MCNDLAVEEVIYAARIDENGDQLLFKKPSNFYHLRVGVAGQRVHCVVGRLGLFLHGFIFGFEVFFRWFDVLILYWFNHEEPTLFAAMFLAPRLRHGWSGSDPYPSYFVVQSFFLDYREGNCHRESVRLSRGKAQRDDDSTTGSLAWLLVAGLAFVSSSLAASYTKCQSRVEGPSGSAPSMIKSVGSLSS
ncbi:hypothetical protein B296_00025927 [Ensete ventricosum]|uniref:Uncharacterized protein n=1 Tax=Ensete ventricosum TaxID=4639 RepID=A0A426ZVH7_ENSVE|nr:hypothetical protein B296_00025927 [Ensete ventricosum]